MNTSYIIDHLKIARDLAKVDGKAFLAYLIDMAIAAAEAAAEDTKQAANSDMANSN